MSNTLLALHDSLSQALVAFDQALTSIKDYLTDDSDQLELNLEEADLDPGAYEISEIHISRTGDGISLTVDNSVLADFVGVVPAFEAPKHRFAICTKSGDVFYVDHRIDKDLDVARFVEDGEMPTVEDLGVV